MLCKFKCKIKSKKKHFSNKHIELFLNSSYSTLTIKVRGLFFLMSRPLSLITGLKGPVLISPLLQD